MAKLLTATAIAGSLAMASFIWGTAQATPAPSAIHAPGNGITLVGHHGGGGGGGGGGRVGGGGGGGGAGTESGSGCMAPITTPMGTIAGGFASKPTPPATLIGGRAITTA